MYVFHETKDVIGSCAEEKYEILNNGSKNNVKIFKNKVNKKINIYT